MKRPKLAIKCYLRHRPERCIREHHIHRTPNEIEVKEHNVGRNHPWEPNSRIPTSLGLVLHRDSIGR